MTCASFVESVGFDKLAELPGDPLAVEEEDERSLFNDAARRLMIRYMTDIYSHTTVNLDHVLGVLIREQRSRHATELEYRDRAFLAMERIRDLGHHQLHPDFEDGCHHLVFDEEGPRFKDFLELCIEDGVLLREGEPLHEARIPAA